MLAITLFGYARLTKTTSSTPGWMQSMPWRVTDVGDRGRQRLLHEDVLAALERPFGELEVRGGGGRDDHGGDVRVVECNVARFDSGRLREATLDEGAALGARVDHVLHVAIWK